MAITALPTWTAASAAPREPKHLTFVLRKGKFTGKTLKEVAETDEGLRYLDTLRDKTYQGSYLSDCLEALFADPIYGQAIAELAKIHDYADYRDLYAEGVIHEGVIRD